MTRIFSSKRSVEGTGDARQLRPHRHYVPDSNQTPSAPKAGVRVSRRQQAPGRQTLTAREGGSRPPEDRKGCFEPRTRDPAETAGDGHGGGSGGSGRRRVRPARRPWSPAEELRARGLLAPAGWAEARRANVTSSSLENRHLCPGTAGAVPAAVAAGRSPQRKPSHDHAEHRTPLLPRSP